MPPMPMRLIGTQPLPGVVSVERQTMVLAATPAALPAGANTASCASDMRVLFQVLGEQLVVLGDALLIIGVPLPFAVQRLEATVSAHHIAIDVAAIVAAGRRDAGIAGAHGEGLDVVRRQRGSLEGLRQTGVVRSMTTPVLGVCW